MPEAEYGVTPNIEVVMLSKSKTDLFDPFAFAVCSVHANNDGHIEQFSWVASRNDRFDIGFRPASNKWSHVTLNVEVRGSRSAKRGGNQQAQLVGCPARL
jgi:hypothetical protein